MTSSPTIGYKRVKLILSDNWDVSPVFVSPYVVRQDSRACAGQFTPLVYGPRRIVAAQHWCGLEDCTAGIYWTEEPLLRQFGEFEATLEVIAVGPTLGSPIDRRSAWIECGNFLPPLQFTKGTVWTTPTGALRIGGAFLSNQQFVSNPQKPIYSIRWQEGEFLLSAWE